MGLFKQPEYRRFNPKPRYWDPEAEARKEREKRIRTELGLPEEGDEYIPATRLFMILIIILIAIFYLATYKIDLIMKLF